MIPYSCVIHKKQTNKQTNKQINKQTNKQTHTHTHTHTQAHKHTHTHKPLNTNRRNPHHYSCFLAANKLVAAAFQAKDRSNCRSPDKPTPDPNSFSLPTTNHQLIQARNLPTERMSDILPEQRDDSPKRVELILPTSSANWQS